MKSMQKLIIWCYGNPFLGHNPRV